MNSTNAIPRWGLWAILVLLAVILSVVSAELFVRVVPGPWTSSFFYRYDPVFGTWHLSDFIGDNVSVDYTIRDIHLNQFGMRDRERTLAKDPGTLRVAVLGDSILEGMQVGDREMFSARLEELLSARTEVLNFSVSGFGTLQEYLAYKELARAFKPDIVILGFYTGNDVRNNSEALETLYNGGASDRPFLMKREDGSWEIVPVPAKPASQNPMVLFLKRHFALYRFLWFQKGKFSSLFAKAPVERTEKSVETERSVEGVQVYLTRLFAPPEEESFTLAWEATEHSIDELRRDVEADGGKFVLVLIPDPAVFEPDPRVSLEKFYEAALPKNYDPEYPQKHLARFASERGIAYFDLTPVLKAYRDEHGLSFPYFSFPHDGHWSALGHDVAARAVADYLKTSILPSYVH